MSEDLTSIIAHSLLISEKSGGAFDITVGPLVNLWGFGPIERNGNYVPDEESRLNKHASRLVTRNCQ